MTTLESPQTSLISKGEFTIKDIDRVEVQTSIKDACKALVIERLQKNGVDPSDEKVDRLINLYTGSLQIFTKMEDCFALRRQIHPDQKQKDKFITTWASKFIFGGVSGFITNGIDSSHHLPYLYINQIMPDGLKNLLHEVSHAADDITYWIVAEIAETNDQLQTHKEHMEQELNSTPIDKDMLISLGGMLITTVLGNEIISIAEMATMEDLALFRILFTICVILVSPRIGNMGRYKKDVAEQRANQTSKRIQQ